MFLGIPMTPAAAERLKDNNLPQAFAVCVPLDLYDKFEVKTAPPIERSTYVMQVLADLRNYATGGTGAWGLPEIGSITMKWGLVDHLRDTSGRKIPEGDVFVGWLNREIRRQKPPSIAIREDGLELFIELGDFLNTRIPGFREARPKKGDLISHSEARRHAQKRFGWVDNQYQDKDGTGRYLEDTPQWAQ